VGKRNFDEAVSPDRVEPIEQVKKGRMDAKGSFYLELAEVGHQPNRTQ
jgi:hypothetical protein